MYCSAVTVSSVSHFLLLSKDKLITSLLPSSPIATRKHSVVPMQHSVLPTLCLQSNGKNIPSALNLWSHPRKSHISFIWCDTNIVNGSPFRKDQLPVHFGSHYLTRTSERCYRKKSLSKWAKKESKKDLSACLSQKKASKQTNKIGKSPLTCIEWSLSTFKGHKSNFEK